MKEIDNLLNKSDELQNNLDESFRRMFGVHYTNEENILKLIKPLFLDKLYAELEACTHDINSLKNLLQRISQIKFFDPACGSGNFLVVTFKEIFLLQIQILDRLFSLKHDLKLDYSFINSTQFYGIELEENAYKICLESLEKTEMVLLKNYQNYFRVLEPFLPLRQGSKIVCENALRIDWQDICPKNKNEEVYVLGNPPYLGYRYQQKQQKQDKDIVLKNIKSHKKLDYVTCWFIEAAKYIQNSQAEFAFFSTKSICQGEHIPILWPNILSKNLEISFAYQPFTWENNANENAGIPVIIIGIRNIKDEPKYLFYQDVKKKSIT